MGTDLTLVISPFPISSDKLRRAYAEIDPIRDRSMVNRHSMETELACGRL